MHVTRHFFQQPLRFICPFARQKSTSAHDPVNKREWNISLSGTMKMSRTRLGKLAAVALLMLIHHSDKSSNNFYVASWSKFHTVPTTTRPPTGSRMDQKSAGFWNQQYSSSRYRHEAIWRQRGGQTNVTIITAGKSMATKAARPKYLPTQTDWRRKKKMHLCSI